MEQTGFFWSVTRWLWLEKLFIWPSFVVGANIMVKSTSKSQLANWLSASCRELGFDIVKMFEQV